MIEFEIDGKKLGAEQGKMIIEVADAAGIYIPRFCYHKKLSIAANCRMCLVEVEKSGKPLPACATPITQGMKVSTCSQKAISAQRAVMEFLLINHPLDCPICDQGGECELQDLAMGYGKGLSRYDQGKRSVHDKNLGPLVESFMTRCIQCTRCVRFGDEIAGMRELGAYNRGENLEIGTYVEKAMQSELSGNVIDVCPVGALTSKPFQYTARAWEMVQHPSIAPHDCVGSNIYVHTRGEQYSPARDVMRVVPRAHESINEVWLSDRDRFSYAGLESKDRVTQPMIKKSEVWETVDWETALKFVAKKISHISEKFGADQIAALASPNSTLEEFYLLQKLMRGLGSNNIDHRIHQLDFTAQKSAPLYPNLSVSLEDLEKVKTFLLIGANPRYEQPLLNHRIRKAVEHGAKVFCINPIDYQFNFTAANKMIVSSELLPLNLAKLLNALAPDTKLPADAIAETAHQTFAKKFKNSEKTIVLLGQHALNHPQASAIHAYAEHIAQEVGGTVGYLTDGANAAGAWLAGAVPHRMAGGLAAKKPGLSAAEIFLQTLKAYLLFNVEPELDHAQPAIALTALKNAEFVVCMTTFMNQAMQQYADVILPIAPFTENSGTLINIEGRWQSFTAAALPLENARPAWQALCELAGYLELDNFSYYSSEAISQQLQDIANKAAPIETHLKLPGHFTKPKGLFRIAEWLMYCSDNLVRRSQPLQDTLPNHMASIHVHPTTALNLGLADGESVIAEQDNSSITLPLIFDARLAENNVLIPSGLAATAGFGSVFGDIQLRSATRG